jgi:hypothetical protein
LLIGINTLIIGSIHAPFSVPQWFVKWQLSTPWIVLWKITMASWWMTIIPITTLMIVRFSNGCSLRTILLALLSFPFFLSLVLSANLKWSFLSMNVFSSFANILTVLGCVAFIYFTLISKTWTRALLSGRFLKYGRTRNKNYWSFVMKIRWSFFSLLYLMLIYGIPLLIIPIFISATLFTVAFIVIVTLFLYVCILEYFKK